MSPQQSPAQSPPPQTRSPAASGDNIVDVKRDAASAATQQEQEQHQTQQQQQPPQHQHQIDPALSGPGGDPRSNQTAVNPNAPPPPVPLTYHPNPYSLENRWQQPPPQTPPSHHTQSPGFSAAVFQPPRYPHHQHHHPPPPPPSSHHPHHHPHHPDPYPHHHHMPHRVDSQDRPGSLSHRAGDDRPYDQQQHQHPGSSHPSPPPIATLHNSGGQGAGEGVNSTTNAVPASSPPLNQSAYYSAPPPPTNGPGMHSSYGYPPHARYPAQDPHAHAHAMSAQAAAYPPASSSGHYGPPAPAYIVHTDDAATKLNDRVRRKCYNCRTTDTSTWRRSSLTPGKVLCNKCGLFERTHSRPRPEQFPHKRGPIVTTTFKSSRSPPPASSSASASRLPPMNQQPPQPQHLPPHHYDHPSITGLMTPRQDGHAQPQSQAQAQSQQYAPPPPTSAEANGTTAGPGQSGSAPIVPKTESTSIGSLLNTPNGAAVDEKPIVSSASQPASSGNSLKRPLSPGASPKQGQRSPPYAAYQQQRAGASA